MTDMNEDCPCRFELQNCDNTFHAFDTITGECICTEQSCPVNHSWDFDACECACDDAHECNEQMNSLNMIWDSVLCQCVCIPQQPEDETLYTWSLVNCQFECIIQECEAGKDFNYETCSCECSPTACPAGEEFFYLY